YGFRDIGTLAPGRLADLVVLDANPLEDIQNSDNITHVMLNGRLYDAATLNETVTGTRQRQPYFWEADGDGGAAAVARAQANAEANGYDHD
ncbi:MAG: amidohydrolase family protein, partial [Sphingomonas sp.]